MRVLILAANGFEDSELLCPMYRLAEAGYQVDIASLEWGEITGKRGYKVAANLSVDDVSPDGYRLLLIPGGKAPAALRENGAVLELVRQFAAARKPIAAICHGPQVLISAGLLKGRRATAYKTVASELKAAGALYEDSPVVVDDIFITSRMPSDIPFFMKEIIRILSEGRGGCA
ncbi:type 1 glutamine amidotransferase [Thermosulfuriphilus ammonigenes]|uniref:Type 1 glutamine amidotransferase n=1 Tax=Thermosulfuriphilus ammonigenes TaxID=1936021 RepID=A0A6G7PW34_9BACT|nr:type 1 glutamine amidotransferase domain-containing protein [Thermosulfuriphilus ammonigenes]MBA2848167.1 protease I [Thermosulfuriphilus ammonigenes]QIJ71658.1 type 1 glutamine amidotransferase [Thermosulfuriphilus ammonigenes]